MTDNEAIADRLAETMGWNNYQTTGSIRAYHEHPAYVMIDDGDAPTYAVHTSAIESWLDARDDDEADYSGDFCGIVDLVDGDELQQLVDALGEPLGGWNGDAYTRCHPHQVERDILDNLFSDRGAVVVDSPEGLEVELDDIDEDDDEGTLIDLVREAWVYSHRVTCSLDYEDGTGTITISMVRR
jgi:hypothetical protein